ncbi:hypothetical protein BN1723_016366, partial [Verticillium longisporum]
MCGGRWVQGEGRGEKSRLSRSLVVNEFHNRNFICTNYVPSTDPAAGYENVSNDNRVCTAVGSIPGNDFVNGDAYASLSFGYEWANRWRNFGILIAFMLGFLVVYMVAAEFVSEKKSKGEVLVFRRGYKPSAFNEKHAQDDPEDMVRVGPVTTPERARVTEKGQDAGFIQRQTSIFHWNNVCYEVKIKKETRRILDNVDGWQVQLCLWRGWQRLIGDPSITVGSLIGNTVMALIIGSVFYNLQNTSASFFQRGALLFFALLMNAFASALEILTLYAQRPIVEKHSRYALYHPSAEAVASMLVDMPYKLLNCLVFNITLYFITNLRREAGAFFFFLLISFFTVLAMSMIFRTIASSSRTLSQAMVPAAILILILVIFTGFVIPTPYMLDWCRWLNYVDPLAYAFE